MGPKAKIGVIMGIEDNMPAYRVYDPEIKTIRKIPFVQTVTHEGHFPFRDNSLWSTEEKEMPESFVPTLDAHADADEWARYKFSPEAKTELESDFSGTRDAFLFGEAPESIDVPPPLDPPAMADEKQEAESAEIGSVIGSVSADRPSANPIDDNFSPSQVNSGVPTPTIPVSSMPSETKAAPRTGPVLRERKIVSQLNPPKPVSKEGQPRPKFRSVPKEISIPMPKIFESPLKSPQAVWEQDSKTGIPPPRPNDPHKVWNQTLPATAALQS